MSGSNCKCSNLAQGGGGKTVGKCGKAQQHVTRVQLQQRIALYSPAAVQLHGVLHDSVGKLVHGNKKAFTTDCGLLRQQCVLTWSISLKSWLTRTRPPSHFFSAWANESMVSMSRWFLWGEGGRGGVRRFGFQKPWAPIHHALLSLSPLLQQQKAHRLGTTGRKLRLTQQANTG